jgi:formate hydrogenlyase transcriptional activator
VQNRVERAVILSKDGVLPNPLPSVGTQPATVFQEATTFKDSERAVILHALKATAWVIGGQKGAATKLGLKRTTLICKMQKLGICRPVLLDSPDPEEPVGNAHALVPQFQ